MCSLYHGHLSPEPGILYHCAQFIPWASVYWPDIFYHYVQFIPWASVYWISHLIPLCAVYIVGICLLNQAFYTITCSLYHRHLSIEPYILCHCVQFIPRASVYWPRHFIPLYSVMLWASVHRVKFEQSIVRLYHVLVFAVIWTRYLRFVRHFWLLCKFMVCHSVIIKPKLLNQLSVLSDYLQSVCHLSWYSKCFRVSKIHKS